MKLAIDTKASGKEILSEKSVSAAGQSASHDVHDEENILAKAAYRREAIQPRTCRLSGS